MSFADRLHRVINEKNSRLLVGLDPHPGQIPRIFYNAYADTDKENLLFDYFKMVIDAARPFAAAFKPQIAFFEAYGLKGLSALKRLLMYLKEHGELVILDGKRNDIGSTASAYARAFLADDMDFSADALTVNPFLGSDGIEPFLKYPDKAIFSLLKTSNPSSGEIQDLILKNGEPLYVHLARLITRWNETRLNNRGFGPVGVVVGATYPDHMQKLRALLPHSIFLVPGYGAQGGSLDAIRLAFLPGGKGALINSSRMINFPKNFSEKQHLAVETAARNARDEINQLTAG
jgi:orotidine-5'-phosphate decarboxylase